MTSVSKRKGNAFENEIAKKLNIVFEATTFHRTPGSGAWMGKSHAIKRAGVAIEAQDTLRGDLITPKDFPYIIECKFNSVSPSYHSILAGKDAKLDQWLIEVEYDAEHGNRLPMLIFKTPRKGTFVAVPYKDIDVFQFEYFLKYRNYAIVSFEMFTNHKDLFYKPVDSTEEL